MNTLLDVTKYDQKGLKMEDRHKRKLLRQRAFIDAYQNNLFNVSAACGSLSMSRKTYYEWLQDNDSEQFKAALKTAHDEKCDFVENALLTKIREGDTTAIIFAAKCLLKDRGYLERTHHHVTTETMNPDRLREMKDAVYSAVLDEIGNNTNTVTMIEESTAAVEENS